MNWETLRQKPAAIIPRVDSEVGIFFKKLLRIILIDTRNFDHIEPNMEVEDDYHSTDTFKGYTFIQPKFNRPLMNFK